MKTKFITVREFPSKSSSGKVYTVKQNAETGALGCSCPVWVYDRNGDRTCYHTMKVLAEMNQVVVGVQGRVSLHAFSQEKVSIEERPRKLRL